MKVLYVIGSLDLGGAERRLVELLKGLRARQPIVCELVVLSDTIFFDDVNRLGIKVHKVVRKTKKDPRVFLNLYRICKEFGPDIIHAWESMPSLYAAPIARLLGIKFINGMIMDATANRRVHPKLWLREKLTFPLSDVIVANSHAGLLAHRAPRSKSYCVHNGIDLTRFQHLEAVTNVRKRFNIQTPRTVGMVARFSPLKDYGTYLHAAICLLRERSDVTFLAVGDGPTLEACRKMVPPEFRETILFPAQTPFWNTWPWANR
jgi:glycosyltransferase involved in cell wall biosynthesis